MKEAMATEGLVARSDRELVYRVRSDQDTAAFRAILERHGPMVFQVCKRILCVNADVEDAFQATFLVLIRRGHSIRRRESLASWLHGVARRTALKLRTQTDRRRRRENRAARPDAVSLGDETPWHEVRLVLDEEIGRLPETHRAVLVLLYLEGRTQEEAAAQLAISKSTLQRRLLRARDLFGRRLARRGIVPAMLLATRIVSDCADAAVPHGLFMHTVNAIEHGLAGRVVSATVLPSRVVALTDGVAKAMLYAKYKSVAAMLACGLALGIGMQQFSLPPASAQEKSLSVASRPKATTADIEPIDPNLVFDPAVQKQLRLSPNQVRQLTEARDKGGATAADQHQRAVEIDTRIRKLEEEIAKLCEQRDAANHAVAKAQTEQVRSAIPNVLSRDAVQQLRLETLQRMRLSDVLLNAKVRARLELNDEQVKKIQELADKSAGRNRYAISTFSTQSVLFERTQALPETHHFVNTYLGIETSPAELLKVLTPAQRETLERLSGVSYEKK